MMRPTYFLFLITFVATFLISNSLSVEGRMPQKVVLLTTKSTHNKIQVDTSSNIGADVVSDSSTILSSGMHKGKITSASDSKPTASSSDERTPDPRKPNVKLLTTHATLRENLPKGTSVGFLTVSDADDSMTFDNHTFTIIDDSKHWSIGGENGDELLTLFSADYESRDEYSVRVRVTDDTLAVSDSGAQVILEVVVEILDSNDVKPNNLEFDNLAIMEGTQLQANGKAFIGALSFEDPDSENEFEFLLGGKDSQLFELKGFPATKSGVLYTKSVFDYDDAQENAYEISVTINDGSAGEGTTSHFTVTVTNDNDENPTNCNLQGTIFDENSVNVVIGSFSFEDPDPNDEEDKVSFTSQHDFFKYVNSTIIITKPLDYESEQPGMGPLFPVKFSVNDGDNEKLECAYELTLKDVNDNAPTKMTFTPGENSDAGENQGKAVITVSEAANAGEVVTKITFEDADRNCKQQNFVLESSDAWAKQVFSIKKSEDRISSATGSFFELVMKNNTMLDHEIKKSYDMVLILSDGDSQHALKQRVTVNIQDANDVTPSEIEIDENAISEDAPIGTIVGVITFKDLDSIGEYSVTFVNEEDGETFSISENHNADPETPASFTLLTKKTFSAHTKKDYKVLIEISDGAHTAQQTLLIEVTDTNDNPPTDLTLELVGKTLRENSKIGTLVGYVRFNDLDDLSSQTFTWQVKNINPAEEGKVNFKITDVVANEKEEKKHSFYGKLLTAVGDLNYEQHRLYVIEVEISDGMYAQKKEFEIKLSDSNDNAPSFLDFAQNLVVGGDKTSASGKGSTVIGTFPKKCDGSFSADDKGKDKGAATAKACALTYLTVEGNKKDVWAVKTGNTQAKGRYPQWEPLCPAKLMLLEGAVTCKHLKTEDFVNEDIVVVDQTKFCADPEYAEFQNLGKDNPDYVAVTSECQTKR